MYVHTITGTWTEYEMCADICVQSHTSHIKLTFLHAQVIVQGLQVLQLCT
jgi:hypothetical protein